MWQVAVSCKMDQFKLFQHELIAVNTEGLSSLVTGSLTMAATEM